MTPHRESRLSATCDRYPARPGFALAAGLFLLLAVALPCSSVANPALSEKSPFLPPGYGVQEPEPAAPVVTNVQGPLSRELEFRGVVQIGASYQFSLFSKKDNKGYWISENETVAGLSARNYDPDSSTLVVTSRGRSERLTLMAATESPLPVAASPARPVNATTPNPPGINLPGRPNANDDSNRRVIPRRRVILPRQD